MPGKAGVMGVFPIGGELVIPGTRGAVELSGPVVPVPGVTIVSGGGGCAGCAPKTETPKPFCAEAVAAAPNINAAHAAKWRLRAVFEILGNEMLVFIGQ
jgi:hypothetical protein